MDGIYGIIGGTTISFLVVGTLESSVSGVGDNLTCSTVSKMIFHSTERVNILNAHRFERSV